MGLEPVILASFRPTSMPMIGLKQPQPFVEERVLVVLDERRAGAESLLLAPRRAERDGADAVVDQFLHQFAAGHARVGDGEVEAVGDGLVEVMVVNDLETVVGEDFLQPRGPPAVFLDGGNEVELAVGCGLEHRCQRVLRRVARAGGEGVEDAVDIDRAEGPAAVAFRQAGVGAVVKFVGDGGDADALSGVAKCLGAGDLQDVIIGIATDAGLVRRFERTTQIFAEVHREVGEVLDDDDVVFLSHFRQNLQLIFCQAEPRGVIRVGIDDRRDAPALEVAFQLVAELFAPEIIDIERIVAVAHDGDLLFLHGEARVDEENRVLARRTLPGR